MHIATFFDSKESSSGYSINHNIAISSDSAHFGIPKNLHGNTQVKLLQNYCPDVLTILYKLTDSLLTYLLTPCSRVLLEKLTSKLCC